MKNMKLHDDFLARYWFIILTIMIILVFTLWFINTASSLSIIFPIGMASQPWYLTHRRKRHYGSYTPSFYHPFISRALSVMMFEFIFNRNRIVPISLMKENGITSGQMRYTTTVLKKKGIVKNHNARSLKLISFQKAKELEESEVFKGGTAWT